MDSCQFAFFVVIVILFLYGCEGFVLWNLTPEMFQALQVFWYFRGGELTAIAALSIARDCGVEVPATVSVPRKQKPTVEIT